MTRELAEMTADFYPSAEAEVHGCLEAGEGWGLQAADRARGGGKNPARETWRVGPAGGRPGLRLGLRVELLLRCLFVCLCVACLFCCCLSFVHLLMRLYMSSLVGCLIVCLPSGSSYSELRILVMSIVRRTSFSHVCYVRI